MLVEGPRRAVTPAPWPAMDACRGAAAPAPMSSIERTGLCAAAGLAARLAAAGRLVDRGALLPSSSSITARRSSSRADSRDMVESGGGGDWDEGEGEGEGEGEIGTRPQTTTGDGRVVA
jgi:hypothetical protein